MENAGFYGEVVDGLSGSNSFVNFQVWLYEGSNNIEFRYGKSEIANVDEAFEGDSGAVVGLWPGINQNTYLLEGDGFAVQGTVPNENGSISYLETFPILKGTPAEGTVYTFSFDATSTKTVEELTQLISITPQPVRKYLELQSKVDFSTPIIYDTKGSVVSLSWEENKADVSALPAGIYILKTTIEGKDINLRFNKL